MDNTKDLMNQIAQAAIDRAKRNLGEYSIPVQADDLCIILGVIGGLVKFSFLSPCGTMEKELTRICAKYNQIANDLIDSKGATKQ